MDLLLVAFGTFAIVEFVRTVLGSMTGARLPPAVLLLAALVASSLLAYPFENETQVALGFAGTGLAAVVQKVHRLLSAAGDAQQVKVLTTARGPARF